MDLHLSKSVYLENTGCGAVPPIIRCGSRVKKDHIIIVYLLTSGNPPGPGIVAHKKSDRFHSLYSCFSFDLSSEEFIEFIPFFPFPSCSVRDPSGRFPIFFVICVAPTLPDRTILKSFFKHFIELFKGKVFSVEISVSPVTPKTRKACMHSDIIINDNELLKIEKEIHDTCGFHSFQSFIFFKKLPYCLHGFYDSSGVKVHPFGAFSSYPYGLLHLFLLVLTSYASYLRQLAEHVIQYVIMVAHYSNNPCPRSGSGLPGRHYQPDSFDTMRRALFTLVMFVYIPIPVDIIPVKQKDITPSKRKIARSIHASSGFKVFSQAIVICMRISCGNYPPRISYYFNMAQIGPITVFQLHNFRRSYRRP